MIAPSVKPSVTRPPDEFNAADFCQHVGLTNPFLIDRVTDPDQAAELDAPTIHDAEFQKLKSLANTARDQHCAIGVVLSGNAGMGKSHLLGAWPAGQIAKGRPVSSTCKTCSRPLKICRVLCCGLPSAS